MRILVLLLIAACSFTVPLLHAPATAQDYFKGALAYQQEDYPGALQEWRPLAEQGDVFAQTSLGYLYEHGLGVAQNYDEALKWYSRSALQGNASAQYNLAGLYANGHGVLQDLGKAATWYRRAANQGYPEAQSSLGTLYETGAGVPQDMVEALMWFSLSDATKRNALAARMTPEQIAKAHVMARDWIGKHE